MIFNLQHFIWHRLFYETLHASFCVYFQMRNLTLCQLIPVNIKTVFTLWKNAFFLDLHLIVKECIFFFKIHMCNSTQTSSSKLASTRSAWFLLIYEQLLGEIRINWKSLCAHNNMLGCTYSGGCKIESMMIKIQIWWEIRLEQQSASSQDCKSGFPFILRLALLLFRANFTSTKSFRKIRWSCESFLSSQFL